MDTRDKVAVWIAEYDRSMIAMIKEGGARKDSRRIILDIYMFEKCIYCTEIGEIGDRFHSKALEDISREVKKYVTKEKFRDRFIIHSIKEPKEKIKFNTHVFFEIPILALQDSVENMEFIHHFITLQYLTVQWFRMQSGKDVEKQIDSEESTELENNLGGAWMERIIEIHKKGMPKKLGDCTQLRCICLRGLEWLEMQRRQGNLVNTD